MTGLPGDGDARLDADLAGARARAGAANEREVADRNYGGRIAGLGRLRRRLRQMDGELRERVRRENELAAETVHRRGLQLMDELGIGEQTGRLRRFYRWRVSRNGLAARVGYLTRRHRSIVYYAPFLHNGTVRMVARPWHQMAVDETRLRWATNLRSMLSEIVNDVELAGRRVSPAPRRRRSRFR